MAEDPGPLVRRRQLGTALRRYREAAGLSAKEVAERLLSSPAKISRIETAQRNATLRDVRDLCEIYGILDPSRRRQLMDLARESRARGWWQGAGLAPALERFIGMEGSAAVVNVLQLVVIPGLLQTRDYAAAVIGIFGAGEVLRDSHDVGDVEAQKNAVNIRMLRQEILTSETLPTVQVVLDEAALHRIVGNRQIMRDQFLRLVNLAAKDAIDLRILPFSAGAHAGMAGGFTILEFPSPATPDLESAMSTVVYTESPASGNFVEQPAAVESYRVAFAKARTQALPLAASVDLLRVAARKM
jgi:transcriptional regulator with XRE-family HTH domain